MSFHDDQSSDSGTDGPDDPLTRAGDDANANFWYDDAGGSVAPCDSVPPPTVVSKDKIDWVEICLVDRDGNPIPGETYEITLPDGSKITGTLNSKGTARVDGVDPGNCEITFPDLDEDVWHPT
jgi:hypothetical protein